MKVGVRLHVLMLLCFLLVCSAAIVAQEPYQPGKIIPPSPTSASLGLYGEFKVGYYTGTADIDIPLYDIKTANHSLPIHMKYNASGFRVSEMASWVGLGWSFLAGGAVTRTVRGLDDLGSNGYHSGAPLPLPGPDGRPKEQDVAAYQQIMNGGDGEPDIISYNFGSYSGKFVMGKLSDGSLIYMDDRNNLKVEYVQNNHQWVITTADGYKYLFGTEERATNYYYSSMYDDLSFDAPLSSLHWDTQPDAITAWYLDRIEAPNGEAITFTYAQITAFSISLMNKSEQIYNQVLYDQNGCQNPANLPATSTSVSCSKQVIGDVYLKEIDFDYGKIEFGTTDRDDIDYDGNHAKPQKLSDIIIKDLAGNQLKKFHLDYGYFTGQSQRLRLNSITEYSGDNQAKPPYLFTYYNPDNLPPKYTKSIDHWGFYNGKNNTTLVPYFLSPVGDQFFEGADRSPDGNVENLKAAVLSSIAYPTGGSTNFEYEPNDYGNLKGNDRYNLVSTGNNAYARLEEPSSHSTFSFDLFDTTSVKFSYSYSKYVENDPDIMNGVQVVYGNLYKDGTAGTVLSFSNWDASASTPQIPPSQTTFKSRLLYPGHYTVSVTYIQGYYTEVGASYMEKVHITQRKGGGLRVKAIRNTENGKVVSVKKFKYENAENISSGRLISQPIYEFYTDAAYTAGAPQSDLSLCFSYAYYVGRMSSSVIPSSLSTGGAIIGYDRVIEYLGENGEGGRNEYYFHNSEETVTGKSYPSMQGIIDPLNGKVAETLVYDASNNLIKTIESIYQVKASTRLGGIKIFQAPMGGQTFDVGFYDNISNWVVTSSDIETYRQPDGNNLTTTTNYFYENPDHLQLTRKEFVNSDGKNWVTKYKYPQDYSSAPSSSFVAGMIGKHIISPVIEEQKLVSQSGVDKLTDGSFTEYFLTNNLYKPLRIYNAELSAPSLDITQSDISSTGQISMNASYKEKVHFDAYDTKGNLNAYHKVGDATQCYIWDKILSLPAAQVFNASYGEIAFTSFETAETGNWTLSGGTVVDGDGVTGSKNYTLSSGNTIAKSVGLSSATKYLISYWSKSGSLSVNGGQGVAGMARNGWTYYEHKITGVTSISITGSGTIDELRLLPVGATMTTYTFDPLRGMTAQCDVNNAITYYEYDNFQRLFRIRDMDRNILKQVEYQYQYEPYNSTPNWQSLTSESDFTCETATVGSKTYNTGHKLQRQQDINPYSTTYNTFRWTDIGTDLQTCAVTPDWVATGNTRCATGTGGYRTGHQEIEQQDMNPYSTTSSTTRWIDNGLNTTACAIDPDWQNSGTYSCLTTNGLRNGQKQQPQQDMNPYSSTYGQTRNITTSDVDACPIECSSCFNENQMCTKFGNCVTGIKIFIQPWDGTSCTYHYEFEDGTWSPDYTQFDQNNCF